MFVCERERRVNLEVKQCWIKIRKVVIFPATMDDIKRTKVFHASFKQYGHNVVDDVVFCSVFYVVEVLAAVVDDDAVVVVAVEIVVNDGFNVVDVDLVVKVVDAVVFCCCCCCGCYLMVRNF